MNIAYLHNLPLEYYPPATNLLNALERKPGAKVRAYSSFNRKGRNDFIGDHIEIHRCKAPDPSTGPIRRLCTAVWWHLKTAVSLRVYRPDVIIYVEPHSAIAAWIYYKILRGKARLFIHHHEYYEAQDYLKPGMRIPHLGRRLEAADLFNRAEWVSQTNEDRLNFVRGDFPDVSHDTWRVLPNYPPADWINKKQVPERMTKQSKSRLIYIGAASLEDTYIEEIVRWVAGYPDSLELHVCGYNAAPEVWQWLKKEQFVNVSYDSKGYLYQDLPDLLSNFDVGLVLYKGNTTNFVYNVPNKVFEYLLCGLEVWYPKEMTGIRNFNSAVPAPLRELSFNNLQALHPENLSPVEVQGFEGSAFIAEHAVTPLFKELGLASTEHSG